MEGGVVRSGMDVESKGRGREGRMHTPDSP